MMLEEDSCNAENGGGMMSNVLISVVELLRLGDDDEGLGLPKLQRVLGFSKALPLSWRQQIVAAAFWLFVCVYVFGNLSKSDRV